MEKNYDDQFRIVFEVITQLLEVDEKPKKKIGYLKEPQAKYGKKSRKNLLVTKIWHGRKKAQKTQNLILRFVISICYHEQK